MFTMPKPSLRARAATYRVQLHAGFTFDDVAAAAGYLADLGVSHLYCSPYPPGRRGQHARLRRGRPGPGQRGARRCRRPSPRSSARWRAPASVRCSTSCPTTWRIAGRDNAWWWDVLENGPSSRYASYFDIDWDPPEPSCRHWSCMPILGDHYGRVLEAGELPARAARAAASSSATTITTCARSSPRDAAPDLPSTRPARRRRGVSQRSLASLATALGRLPPSRGHRPRDACAERHRDKEVIRGRLAELCAGPAGGGGGRRRRGGGRQRRPRRASTRLLERQNYRLAYWRTAGRGARLPALLRHRRRWPGCGWRTTRSSPTPTP